MKTIADFIRHFVLVIAVLVFSLLAALILIPLNIMQTWREKRAERKRH